MRQYGRRLDVLMVVAAMMASGVALGADFRAPQDRFLIGVYSLKPGDRTERNIRDIRDADVDFVFGVPANDVKGNELLEKYGLGSVAFGVLPAWSGGNGSNAGTMREKNPLAKYEEGLARYRDRPCHWMIDVGDEPSALDFPYIGEVVRLVKRRLPAGIEPFLNLYPSYARLATNDGKETRNQLGVATYREYIEAYCRHVPLDYICYDYFVYSCQERNQEKFYAKNYENLQIVADACRRTGRTLRYSAQVNSSRPELHMTEPLLRYQALTAMAYGARLLEWCCYSTAWWTNNVLNVDGTRNDREYFALRNVNRQLHALGRDYVRYRNVATALVGFDAALLAKYDVKSFDRADAEGFRNVRASDGSALAVGMMRALDGGGQALLIVSSDDPYDRRPTEKSVRFRAKGRLCAVGLAGKVPIARSANGELSVPIRSNEAVLVMLAEEK